MGNILVTEKSKGGLFVLVHSNGYSKTSGDLIPSVLIQLIVVMGCPNIYLFY